LLVTNTPDVEVFEKRNKRLIIVDASAREFDQRFSGAGCPIHMRDSRTRRLGTGDRGFYFEDVTSARREDG